MKIHGSDRRSRLNSAGAASSSLVPEKAYEDRDFQWEGDENDAD